MGIWVAQKVRRERTESGRGPSGITPSKVYLQWCARKTLKGRKRKVGALTQVETRGRVWVFLARRVTKARRTTLRRGTAESAYGYPFRNPFLVRSPCRRRGETSRNDLNPISEQDQVRSSQKVRPQEGARGNSAARRRQVRSFQEVKAW